MPFWQEWALLEGLDTYYKHPDPDDPAGAYDDDYDPRFPSASRGDVMAGPEELMAFGMQYSKE